MKVKLRHILMAVCVIVILVCGAIIIKDQLDIRKAEDFDEGVKALYNPSGLLNSLIPSAGAESLDLSEDEVIELEAEPELEPPEVQEDFLQLLAVNEDTVAWLTAGERIDGPVLLRDNEYYLTHNFYQEQDAAGAIFLNESCSIWPEGTILLLHGHNMRSKGMFGTLDDFTSLAYVKQHPIIRFRTIYDEQDRLYVVYSAFHASMIASDSHYFDVMEISFADDAAYEHYLTKTKNRSIWKSPVDVNTDDTLLCLLTCSYANEDGRFILLCRRLREDETEESVTALFN